MAQAKDKFTFYNANICPYGQRAWLALLFKGVDFEWKDCDLQKKQEYFTKAYSKALGHDTKSDGKVPILDHNGELVTESLAVVRYLDLLYPDKQPFFPKNPMQRIAVELITDFAGSVVTAFYGVLFEKDDSKRQEKKDQMKEKLSLLNSRLSEISEKGPFYLGDQISFFEIAMFPFFDRLIVNELALDPGKGITVKECFEGNDRLKTWYEAIKKLPPIEKVHAKLCKDSNEKTAYDFYVKAYKDYMKKKS